MKQFTTSWAAFESSRDDRLPKLQPLCDQLRASPIVVSVQDAHVLRIGATVNTGRPRVRARVRQTVLRRQLSDQPDDQKQDDGANGSRDDSADNAAAKSETDTELRKQHAGDQGTHDADDNIAEQAEAGALHEKAGEPACDGANDQGYNQSCKHDSFPP